MQSAISRIRTELSFFYGLLTFGEDYSICDVCRTSAGQLHQIRKNLVRLPESGRGAPCGRPSQGKTPRTVQIIVRSRKFHTSLATGGRFLGRKKKTIGRGAPCGRPSWAIVASEFRCVCPEDLCGQHWPVSRLILVFYDHKLRWQRCSPFPSAALRVLRG